MADQPDEPDARFTLANERTFLAWNRTALGLIAGGLAVAQFLDLASRAMQVALASLLLVLGAALATASYGRWRANDRALRAGAPLPDSPLPALLAIGVAVVAAAAILAIAIDELA